MQDKPGQQRKWGNPLSVSLELNSTLCVCARVCVCVCARATGLLASVLSSAPRLHRLCVRPVGGAHRLRTPAVFFRAPVYPPSSFFAYSDILLCAKTKVCLSTKQADRPQGCVAWGATHSSTGSKLSHIHYSFSPVCFFLSFCYNQIMSGTFEAQSR